MRVYTIVLYFLQVATALLVAGSTPTFWIPFYSPARLHNCTLFFIFYFLLVYMVQCREDIGVRQ